MARRNLEKDKARFAEWRRQKQGREPIPEELWQIAAVHIGGLSVNRVSREFRLSFSRLREEAQEFGVRLPKARRKRVADATEVAFQELPLKGMFAAPPFVFTNRRRTALKLLIYDGQGFFLILKRFSQGRLRWWPDGPETGHALAARELHILLWNGHPQKTGWAPLWRPLHPISAECWPLHPISAECCAI